MAIQFINVRLSEVEVHAQTVYKLKTKKITHSLFAFRMFAVLNFQTMNLIKLLPVWYAGGIGNNCNALKGVGQLTHAGFILPKLSDYEYKHPFQRNRIEVN